MVLSHSFNQAAFAEPFSVFSHRCTSTVTTLFAEASPRRMMHAKHLTSCPHCSVTWGPWHCRRRLQRQQHLDLPSTPSPAVLRAPYQMQPFQMRMRRQGNHNVLFMPRDKHGWCLWTVLQALPLSVARACDEQFLTGCGCRSLTQCVRQIAQPEGDLCRADQRTCEV